MEEQRVDLIERFLSRVQPDWRDVARGKPASRPAGGVEFIPAPGAAHPDMIVDDEQTKRDRIALGLEAPEAEAPAQEAPQPQGEGTEGAGDDPTQ